MTMIKPASPASLLLALTVALASGCASIEPLPTPSSLPQPSTVAATYLHAVRFEPGSAELAPGEWLALRSFVAGLPTARAARLEIVDPGQVAIPVDGLRQRRQARLRQLLAELEALPVEASGPVALPAAFTARVDPWRTPDSLVVRLVSHEVVLPACPDWSRPLAPDPWNQPFSNLGCANAVNLGLMVADPADLASGRSLGPADGAREAEAVVRYRTDKVKELDEEAFQQ